MATLPTLFDQHKISCQVTRTGPQWSDRKDTLLLVVFSCIYCHLYTLSLYFLFYRQVKIIVIIFWNYTPVYWLSVSSLKLSSIITILLQTVVGGPNSHWFMQLLSFIGTGTGLASVKPYRYFHSCIPSTEIEPPLP